MISLFSENSKIKKVLKILVIFILLISITAWFSCASMQKYLDRSGLKDIANQFDENFNSGNPNDLQKYIDTFDFQRNTIPLEVEKVKISKFRNKEVQNLVGEDITAELLSFPSHVKFPVKQDTARFFIFRKNKLQNNKVILWIAGKGVSEFAFRFVNQLFYDELKHGYNVLVYIPPYHMSRKTDDSPETFFTSNVHHNLLLYSECIRELRTVYSYLEKQKVTSISGWGGSMGASMLCTLTNYEKLEHICIMIPVLDWKTIAYNSEYSTKLIEKYNKNGFDNKLIQDAYNLISPMNQKLNISSEKVLIQYAEYDQLTPDSVSLNFAKINNISNIIGYKKSHATILLSSKLYKDYDNFLSNMSK